ncbi:MAG TPA: UDP-N-acetylmuramate dehydrogenase [Planctomycetota bacterium]
MNSPAASLADRFPLRRAEPLRDWTTLKIGGPAEYFFEPDTPEALGKLLHELAAEGVPWTLLGGGANTLAPDGGVPGAVIHTGRMRRVFQEDGPALRVWPGATLPSLARTGAAKGFVGLEALIGVPGNLGGGLAMNAGGAGWGLWDQVREVVLWTPGAASWEDGLAVRTPAEVRPSYRDGNLRGAVVIEAVLEFQIEHPDKVRTRMEELLRRKNATQPVSLASAGCAFKNPAGDSAGRLIDAAGLKGAREGTVLVSERHANFLVNEGGATAAQVRRLLERIEGEVRARFGVTLSRELVVLPEPGEPVRGG